MFQHFWRRPKRNPKQLVDRRLVVANRGFVVSPHSLLPKRKLKLSKSSGVGVDVISPKCRRCAVWFGGSLMASLVRPYLQPAANRIVISQRFYRLARVPPPHEGTVRRDRSQHLTLPTFRKCEVGSSDGEGIISSPSRTKGGSDFIAPAEGGSNLKSPPTSDDPCLSDGRISFRGGGDIARYPFTIFPTRLSRLPS